MNRMESKGIHVIRETAGTANPGNKNKIFF